MNNTNLDYDVCWRAAGKAFDAVYARALPSLPRDANTNAPFMLLTGIPRGGIVPMFMLRENSQVNGRASNGVAVYTRSCNPKCDPAEHLRDIGTIIVDDLIDTGETLQPYLDAGLLCVVLFAKPGAPKHENLIVGEYLPTDEWVKFFWEVDENDGAPEQNVRRLLQYIGEDPTREGLVDTPARVCRALKEMTAGYRANPAEILSRQFDCASNNVVVSRGIRFASMCEHHLLPFTGVAHVGYLPTKRVVGLSKLARLVDCYATRLQLQERMTNEIADALMQHIDGCMGAGVIVTAHHSCMGCRGVRKHDSEMVTSSLRGVFLNDEVPRNEFLTLCRI